MGAGDLASCKPIEMLSAFLPEALQACLVETQREYAVQLIYYWVSWLCRWKTAPQYWPRNSLILYQMDGRSMLGAALIKEYSCERCSALLHHIMNSSPVSFLTKQILPRIQFCLDFFLFGRVWKIHQLTIWWERIFAIAAINVRTKLYA